MTRAYFDDAQNCANDAKILQCLMDNMYIDIDGMQQNGVRVSVGVGSLDRTIKATATQGAYQFTIGFYTGNAEKYIEIISDATRRKARFFCRLKNENGKITEEFEIPISGSRQHLIEKCREIADKKGGAIA